MTSTFRWVFCELGDARLTATVENGRITSMQLVGDDIDNEVLRSVSLTRVRGLALDGDGAEPQPISHVQPRSGDDFFRHVADYYRQAAARGGRGVGRRIAEHCDVPYTTAHRWIRECRKRGYLPQVGRKGRLG